MDRRSLLKLGVAGATAAVAGVRFLGTSLPAAFAAGGTPTSDEATVTF
jgi:hypothetical protein